MGDIAEKQMKQKMKSNLSEFSILKIHNKSLQHRAASRTGQFLSRGFMVLLRKSIP